MVTIQDLTSYWDTVRSEGARYPLNTPGREANEVPFPQMLEAPTLQNVSLAVKSEQLVAVIGPVGAGKVCSQNSSCKRSF